MRRRVATVAMCGALACSGAVASSATAGDGVPGYPAKKCKRLFNKYEKALDKGQEKKAERILKRYYEADCGAE